ncbi:MAG: hypothetical protein ACR2O1_12800 [Boseongicola sp.]
MTTATRTKVGPSTPIFRPVGPYTAANNTVRDWNNVRYLDERMFSDIGLSTDVPESEKIRDFYRKPE